MVFSTVVRSMTVDELTAYGMQRMDDEEIEEYLAFHSLGVLALPTDGAPYLLPMSYGYDGGSKLYFSFLVGERSRKAELSEAADSASFLVYNAETMFHWQSVVLVGSIRALSDEQSNEITESRLPKWRPEIMQTASDAESMRLFEFQIEERSGIKHMIRPPSFWQRTSREASR